MKTITTLIAFLSMFSLVSEAFSGRYESTTVLSGSGGCVPLTNILSSSLYEDTRDQDIQQHFLCSQSMLADNGYPAIGTFDAYGVPKNARLSVLLGYVCRAP